jgi:hypothetical protein
MNDSKMHARSRSDTVIGDSDLKNVGSPVVVSTFMRSGTHLTIDLIRRQFPDCSGWKWPLQKSDCLYLAVDVFIFPEGSVRWGARRALRILRSTRHPIVKTHWCEPTWGTLGHRQPVLADWLRANAQVVYVVRNPWSVMASKWAWDVSLGRIERGWVNDKWLREQVARWKLHVSTWGAVPGGITLRFEDILKQPDSAVASLARGLGLSPLYALPLLAPKERNYWIGRFGQLLLFRPRSTEIRSRIAAPRVKELFTAEQSAIIADNAAELIDKYKYEPIN